MFALNPVLDATCTIPAGTTLVGSPGGTIRWQPTDATTDQGLLALRDADMTNITGAAGTLDGQPLDVQSGFATPGAYTIPLAPGSFIKAVDPATAGLTQTRVASGGWIVQIRPLPPGLHTIVLSDLIGGAPYIATFHITVEAGNKCESAGHTREHDDASSGHWRDSGRRGRDESN